MKWSWVLFPLLVVPLGLASCAPPGPAKGAPAALTVRAALRLCDGSHHLHRIAVRGYFRSGPILNGPTVVDGALFDSDTVPGMNAGFNEYVSQYHGMGFSVSNQSPLANSPVIGHLRPHQRLTVGGVLQCAGSMTYLDPTSL